MRKSAGLLATKRRVAMLVFAASPVCPRVEPGLLDLELYSMPLPPIARVVEQVTQPVFSPFPNACKDPAELQNLPPSGLFHRDIPSQDSKGRTTADFLKRVGTRALAAMKTQDEALMKFEECLSGQRTRSSLTCMTIRVQIDNEIKPLVKSARMDLALAQTADEFSTVVFQKTSREINRTLHPLGSVKEVKWKALSPDEESTANKILHQYITEIDAASAQRLKSGELTKKNAREYRSTALLGTRLGHGQDYVDKISRNPLLQFLSSENPADDEILSGVTQMRKNIAFDREMAERAIRAAQERRLSNGRGFAKLDPSVLSLLDYASLVDLELLANPQDCALAITLLNVKNSRSLGNQLAAGIPLFAATLILPAVGQTVAGAVIGSAGGLGYLASAKTDRDASARVYLSKLDSESNEDYDRLKKSDREMKIAIVAPIVGSAISPTIQLGLTGIKALRYGLELRKTASTVAK